MRGDRGTGTSAEGAKPDGIYLPFAVATSLEPLSSCVEAVAWTSTCAARQSRQVEGRVEWEAPGMQPAQQRRSETASHVSIIER